jgi:flagellar protein FlaG
MSLEITGIGQQLTAMERRPGSSVNSTRNTPETLQTDTQQNQTDANIFKTVSQIQDISNMFDRKLQFSVSKELNEVIVKVIDSNTDKVIREIPSAELQKLQIRIKEALGLLFDESI